MYEILHYLTSDEKDVYLDWLSKQRDTIARVAIDRRINRVELGNFGDHKFCRDGVWELRIDVGVPVTESIMRLLENRLYYCFAAETRSRKVLI